MRKKNASLNHINKEDKKKEEKIKKYENNNI